MIFEALALLELAIIIALLVLSRRTARDAMRTGYWTAKSEIHESLKITFAKHQAELLQEPTAIVEILTEWYYEQLIGDKALAVAQGLKEKP